MASNKQIEYITKLATWKNQTIPNNVNDLTQLQASALIDKWKLLKSVGTDKEQTQIESEAEQDNKPVQTKVRHYNKFQAGMAKNAVAAEKEVEWIANNPTAYAELVQAVYEAMEEADDKIVAVHGGVIQ